MSGRKRKSRGGDELTREQQVQRDWTFEAHKKKRGGGGEEGEDDDRVMDIDVDPVPKRGPGRPRKSITPKKKPLPQEEKEKEDGGEGEGEDVLVDLYEAPLARSVPQASRSRSRRRESGLHIPMPSAAAPPSPAPSFRSPSPRPPDTQAKSSSHRSVTQQIRFDAPTPKAAPKSAAKPSAVKLSAATPLAAAQTAEVGAYTPRSASLRKPASGAASLLLVLGLMALVLARLVIFPVRQAPPSAASLGAARRAYLLVPTLTEVGSWVSLRVSGSSGGGSKAPDRSAHFTSAWRRLEAVETGLASHQRDHEQLSGNLTRAHDTAAAASRVNATFSNLDVELARIIQEKDAWSASHEQRQQQQQGQQQETPEAAAAKRLAELTATHQQGLDSRTAGLAGRLESMRDRVEARDGVGKLEAAAGHLDAMRALSGAGPAAEGGKEEKEGDGEGWEENLQESVRVVVNEALLLQRAIRR